MIPMIRSVMVMAMLGVVALAGCTVVPEAADLSGTAESRAVEYLVREVPAWSRENGCFSCHNNGDAARALYGASMRLTRPRSAFFIGAGPGRRDFLREPLADTTAWLTQPDRWDDNKGDPGFSDKALANIQFALALVSAMDAGFVASSDPLRRAALRVATDQAPDGAWHIGSGETVGSPATYGRALATLMALSVLKRADPAEFGANIRLAERWLRALKVRTVLDASVTMLVLATDTSSEVSDKLSRCFDTLKNAQTSDGGWGPYADAPPEPFDTAIALMALSTLFRTDVVKEIIQRGRSYLVSTQNEDGSWPETTRPPRGDSYAQRMSTTGWVTLALFATEKYRAGNSVRISP